MMKPEIRKYFTWMLVLGASFISAVAHAALYVRGQDAQGNQLIYDDVQNLTWYDYSFQNVNLYTFPASFSTTFDGRTLDGWRLPMHIGTPVTCWAHSLTDCSATDELGYLWKDILDNPFGDLPSYGRAYNKAPFNNLSLETQWYWLEDAWYINSSAKDRGHVTGAAVFLVRDGDVLATSTVPLPATFWLFASGVTALAGIRRRQHH